MAKSSFVLAVLAQLAMFTAAFGIDDNDTNLANPLPEPTITRTYEAPTGDGNSSRWNAADLKNYFDETSSNTGAIGGMQFVLGDTEIGRAAHTTNPLELRSDEVLKNENLKKIDSVNAFDEQLRQEIVANSISGDNGSQFSADSENIRCYITRDIPFMYKCEETGLIYGGGMNESGAAARRECLNNCYSQDSCVNVSQNAEAVVEEMAQGYDLVASTERSLSFKADEKRVLDYLSLDWDIVMDQEAEGAPKSEDLAYYIDIDYVDGARRVKTVVKRFLIQATEKKKRLYIGERVREFRIKIYRPEGGKAGFTVNARFGKEYRPDEKWICPSVQDIGNENPGNYAYKCPSGNIHTFNSGLTTYEICADNGTYGDNADGTYSTKEACESVCRIPHECVPSFGIMTTEILKNFREGCLQGQPGCSDEDCRLARLTGQKVLDEIVFDATQNYRKTVENSVQIKGADRPKVLLSEDLDFQERSKEEWKDKAYVAMVENGTYSVTDHAIGEKTEAKYAYATGLADGADYGKVGTAKRVMYWQLAPNALDVNIGQKMYLYAILKVDVEHYVKDEYGNSRLQRDQIWYIKTAKDDHFKPIKRAVDYARVIAGSGAAKIQPNAYAVFKDETFQGGSWFAFSPSQIADYFDAKAFEGNRPFWRIPIVENMGNLVYELPGLVRKRVYSGAYVTPVYSGDFEGSGDGIVKYQIFALYSRTPLTYSELNDKIESKEMVRIFESGNERAYPKTIHSDTHGKFDGIDIFRYGPANRTSIFMRIKPRKEDIGKKAFIYVFVQ